LAQGARFHSDPDKYQLGMGGWSKILAPLFVEFIGAIKEGDHVLDVGCGTGALTFTLANTTKASKIAGIDPSVGYIDHARANNAYPHVTFEVGDAQELPYPDASFDICVSSLILNFIPDTRQGVKEMRRVTKGGRVVAACMWDTTGGMELLQTFWDAAEALDPGAGVERPDKINPYGSLDALSSLWTTTGLKNVETKALQISIELSSFDDFWFRHSTAQGGAGHYIHNLSRDRQEALKDRLRNDILGRNPDGPFSLQARAWAVRGMVT